MFCQSGSEDVKASSTNTHCTARWKPPLDVSLLFMIAEPLSPTVEVGLPDCLILLTSVPYSHLKCNGECVCLAVGPTVSPCVSHISRLAFLFNF